MVHYPSDILGGLLSGLLCAVMAHRIYPVFLNLWKKQSALLNKEQMG